MGLLDGLIFPGGVRSYELHWREAGKDKYLVIEAATDAEARAAAWKRCRPPLRPVSLREVAVRPVELGERPAAGH